MFSSTRWLEPTRYVDAPARVLLSLLFLVSGAGKLSAVAATQAYMASYGLPPELIWPAAALELASGMLLLLGLWLRPLGLLLAGWCVVTALIFHTRLSDQMQMINFLKTWRWPADFSC